MNSKDSLVLVFTGRQVIIQMIRAELESNGIFSIIKDGFQQGIEAGFGGGIPSAIDLYVTESDLARAKEIIEAII